MNDLTISIVSHGHGRLLEALLEDLNGNAALAGVRVILTLNIPEPSFDPDAYPALDLLVIRNLRARGFGANHNAAFAHCATRWFLVLNPDARIPGDPFTVMIASASAIDRVGAVAPRIVGSGGATQDAVRANVTPASLIGRWFFGRRQPILSPPSWRLGDRFLWLAGMCLLLDSDALRAVGGFDERIFLYYEDYDLSARLFLAGHALAVCSEASIVHDAQRSSHRSRRYLKWHLSSLARLWLSRPFWKIRALPAGKRGYRAATGRRETSAVSRTNASTPK